MKDEQKSQTPQGDGGLIKSEWKDEGKMDVGGNKKLGETGGGEGIYTLKLGSEPGGPSILGKVDCPKKGKYHLP